jgi:hypothetical protein
LEVERRSTRLHPLENSLSKRLLLRRLYDDVLGRMGKEEAAAV